MAGNFPGEGAAELSPDDGRLPPRGAGRGPGFLPRPAGPATCPPGLGDGEGEHGSGPHPCRLETLLCSPLTPTHTPLLAPCSSSSNSLEATQGQCGEGLGDWAGQPPLGWHCGLPRPSSLPLPRCPSARAMGPRAAAGGGPPKPSPARAGPGASALPSGFPAPGTSGRRRGHGWGKPPMPGPLPSGQARASSEASVSPSAQPGPRPLRLRAPSSAGIAPALRAEAQPGGPGTSVSQAGTLALRAQSSRRPRDVVPQWGPGLAWSESNLTRPLCRKSFWASEDSRPRCLDLAIPRRGPGMAGLPLAGTRRPRGMPPTALHPEVPSGREGVASEVHPGRGTARRRPGASPESRNGTGPAGTSRFFPEASRKDIPSPSTQPMTLGTPLLGASKGTLGEGGSQGNQQGKFPKLPPPASPKARRAGVSASDELRCGGEVWSEDEWPGPPPQRHPGESSLGGPPGAPGLEEFRGQRKSASLPCPATTLRCRAQRGEGGEHRPGPLLGPGQQAPSANRPQAGRLGAVRWGEGALWSQGLAGRGRAGAQRAPVPPPRCPPSPYQEWEGLRAPGAGAALRGQQR